MLTHQVLSMQALELKSCTTWSAQWQCQSPKGAVTLLNIASEIWHRCIHWVEHTNIYAILANASWQPSSYALASIAYRESASTGRVVGGLGQWGGGQGRKGFFPTPAQVVWRGTLPALFPVRWQVMHSGRGVTTDPTRVPFLGWAHADRRALGSFTINTKSHYHKVKQLPCACVRWRHRGHKSLVVSISDVTYRDLVFIWNWYKD